MAGNHAGLGYIGNQGQDDALLHAGGAAPGTYIRTAHAKGLRNFVVVYRHAMKNAMLPVVTIIGISFALIAGGSVIIESIFSLPGLGRFLVEAMNSRGLQHSAGAGRLLLNLDNYSQPARGSHVRISGTRGCVTTRIIPGKGVLNGSTTRS